jgi:triacylglycerol lipase
VSGADRGNTPGGPLLPTGGRDPAARSTPASESRTVAPLRKLLTPWRTYGALRDQLGSLRGVYLARDSVRRRDDMGAREELVLLIQGFFQTRNIWEVMEDRLRHSGYAVMSFNLGGIHRFNTHPIDTSAEVVAEKIESLAERHGFHRLHIVGHSKGGLIARRYVQAFGGDRRVKSVTTLGTPHHGTPTALLGIAATGFGLVPSSARELLPRSPLVASLGRDSVPEHIPLTSIYSRDDLVVPYWTSILRPMRGEEGRIANVEVRGIGHSQLVWDPGVFRRVRDRLDRAVEAWNVREQQPARAG